MPIQNDKKQLSSISDLLSKYQFSDRDKYYSASFQQYGYELARELGDLKNKSLYIKLAKDVPQGLLETAKSFVMDATNVKSKPRLFMWKLAQLRNEKKLVKQDKSE